MDYPSGMRRDVQTGKPDLYLWIPRDIPYAENPWTRIGALATRGAEKYGRRNMDLACTEEELERFKSSAMRHFMQWITGEQDEDHFASCFFNMLQSECVKWRIKNGKKDS
jgi:hypothetical protein